MQNKNGRHFNRKQGAVLMLSLLLTGTAAFGTIYTLNYAEKKKEDQERVTELEEELRIQEANAAQNVKPTETEQETEDVEVGILNAQAEVKEDPEIILEKQTEAESTQEVLGHVLEEEPVVINPSLTFHENSILDWPVAGNVLIDYSMNGTVYFPTLNVYKYNPALIIGAANGSQVVAAAQGVVERIEEDAETGVTLTLHMGNDYRLVYGQLTDLAVSVGDSVKRGERLGAVAEPTKYYCKEGSNLYFKMTKDGAPVDPFLYLGE